MTQTSRNRKFDGIDTGEAGARENDTNLPKSVPKEQKKDGPALVYITYLLLGAIFVLGCVCGRAFGNFGTTSK